MEFRANVKKGFVLAVSAPSGTGKTSLCDKLASECSFVVRSISVTTRARREGEVSGKDYEFVQREEFQRLQTTGKLLETAEVFGNWYGTPKAAVDQAIALGKVSVMDIDTQGAMNVQRMLGEDAVLIFVFPPSFAELEKRLRGRGKDSPAELAKRLKEAAREMNDAVHYDYWISNESFDEAYSALKSVITAERLRRSRLKPMVFPTVV